LQRKSEIVGTIKRGPGRPPHHSTGASRRYVASMASVGLAQEAMAAVLEISVETLVKHYATEIATAAAAANEAVGRSLWLQAVGGPKKDWTKAVPAAGIWWTKSRMRWKEPPAEHRLSGPGGGPIQSEAVSARELSRENLIASPPVRKFTPISWNSLTTAEWVPVANVDVERREGALIGWLRGAMPGGQALHPMQGENKRADSSKMPVFPWIERLGPNDVRQMYGNCGARKLLFWPLGPWLRRAFEPI
jgi:hypothetical protein